MKRIVLGILILITCSVIPAFAWDYTDDFTSYNSSMWTQIGDFDTNNEITGSVSGGNLNFTSTAASDATRIYVLNSSFDFSQDFDFTAAYHYSHKAASVTDEASLMAGIVNYNGSGSPLYQQIEAGNWAQSSSTSGFRNKRIYYSDGSLIAGEAWAVRNANDGLLQGIYDSYDDTLTLSGYELVTDDDVQYYDQVFSTTYEGFQGLDVGNVQFFLGASVTGNGPVALANGEAYFRNFNANVNVVPEPVSMVLFALGGGAMVLSRRKKQG